MNPEFFQYHPVICIKQHSHLNILDIEAYSHPVVLIEFKIMLMKEKKKKSKGVLSSGALPQQGPLCEKCAYLEYLWCVFSRVWTESSDSVSLRIQSAYGEIRSRKTPNMDTFHARPASQVLSGKFFKMFPRIPQRCIQDPVKHLRWKILRKYLAVKSHYYFCKTLHLIGLTEF